MNEPSHCQTPNQLWAAKLVTKGSIMHRWSLKLMGFIAIVLLGAYHAALPDDTIVKQTQQQLVQNLQERFDYREVCSYHSIPGPGTVGYTRDKDQCDQVITASLHHLVTAPLAQKADIHTLKDLYNETMGITVSEWYTHDQQTLLTLIKGSVPTYGTQKSIGYTDFYVIDRFSGQTWFIGSIKGHVDFASVRSTQRGWAMFSEGPNYGGPYIGYEWRIARIELRDGQWKQYDFCPPLEQVAEHYPAQDAGAGYGLHLISDPTLAWSAQSENVMLTFKVITNDTSCAKVSDFNLYYQMHRVIQVVYQWENENYYPINEMVLEEEIRSSNGDNGPGFTKCIP